MICAFRDSCRGFGLPISENYLEKVNKLWAAAGEAPLTSATDIVEWLEYGVNKDGQWNYITFADHIKYIQYFFLTYSTLQI